MRATLRKFVTLFPQLKVWRRGGRDHISASYYQWLHETSRHYQGNNWLVGERERVLACQPQSLLEVGFGNGQFLREIAPHVSQAIGLDWALSPMAAAMPPNVSLMQADVVTEPLPSVDLVCSADVLEHFRPEAMDLVLAKLHAAGRFNFHVIACYDDGKSHLTIIPPLAWLAKFQVLSSHYRLVEVRNRRGDSRQQVCIIANF